MPFFFRRRNSEPFTENTKPPSSSRKAPSRRPLSFSALSPIASSSSTPPPFWFSSAPSDPYHRHVPGYPAPLTLSRITYPSAEHLYHCLKFSRSMDPDVMDAILAAPTPEQAKRIAHREKSRAERWSDRDALDARRFTLGIKYAQHAALAEELAGMGGYLVYESEDTFWGRRKVDDVGYNEMGRCLMEVRMRTVVERKTNMRSIVEASAKFASKT